MNKYWIYRIQQYCQDYQIENTNNDIIILDNSGNILDNLGDWNSFFVVQGRTIDNIKSNFLAPHHSYWQQTGKAMTYLIDKCYK